MTTEQPTDRMPCNPCKGRGFWINGYTERRTCAVCQGAGTLRRAPRRPGKCEHCHRDVPHLHNVFITARDDWATLCDACKKTDARNSAWHYSGQSAKYRRPFPDRY